MKREALKLENGKLFLTLNGSPEKQVPVKRNDVMNALNFIEHFRADNGIRAQFAPICKAHIIAFAKSLGWNDVYTTPLVAQA